MHEILIDTLIDSVKLIPLLLIVYILIELFEYKFGDSIREKVLKAGKTGPAVGALAGSLPQCGFSVIATALYTQRLLTVGTLLAVYLSTSDEAIPIILSQPGAAKIIVPLILTKIIIALVVGYSIDLLSRESNAKTLSHMEAFSSGKDNIHHHHETVIDEKACCGHQCNSSSRNFTSKELIVHPIIHTVKIFFFVFVATFGINLFFLRFDENNLARLFLGHSFLQPILASLVGLIPNCASSVAITELYLKGAITYGSTVAGLSASAGLGLLILFRENKRRDTVKILFLLIGFSAIAGIIIQSLVK